MARHAHRILAGLGLAVIAGGLVAAPVAASSRATASHRAVADPTKRGPRDGRDQAIRPVALPGYRVRLFATGGASLTQPDDITMLDGHVFVAYQNGVGTMGEPSATGNTDSTIVEYSRWGDVIQSWNVTGKCDGLTDDPSLDRLVGTLNEDGNSSLFTIDPAAAAGSQVQHYTYNVDPATAPTSSPLASGGGTDAIAVQGANIYLSASNPTPDSSGGFPHAALFLVTLAGSTATLSPALLGDAPALDIASNKQVTLALSDPDSSDVVPASVPGVGGDVVLDSQADGELVFLQHAGTATQQVSRLLLGTQIDDFQWATEDSGVLYVVDHLANAIWAIRGTFTPNTVFASLPSDSGVAGLVGTISPTTGTISPAVINLESPAGLLYAAPGQNNAQNGV